MILDALNIAWLHPGLLLILGAWILPLCKGLTKRVLMVAIPAAAVVTCLSMTADTTFGEVSFLGLDVVFGRVDS